MRAFPLEIVTPDGLEFSGQAESLLVHTSDGDVELLASHADFLGSLGIGRARIIVDGKSRLASVAGGFISAKNGRVKVVATTFEFADDIDLERAEAAKAKAEEIIRASKDAREYTLAEARLKRALNRINVKTMK